MSAKSFVYFSSREILEVASGAFIRSPPGPRGCRRKAASGRALAHSVDVRQGDVTEDLCS